MKVPRIIYHSPSMQRSSQASQEEPGACRRQCQTVGETYEYLRAKWPWPGAWMLTTTTATKPTNTFPFVLKILLKQLSDISSCLPLIMRTVANGKKLSGLHRRIASNLAKNFL